MAIPSKEDIVDPSNTFAMRRMYAKRYRDYLEDNIAKLYDGELSWQDARSLASQIGDPERRDAYLRILEACETKPLIIRMPDGSAQRKVTRNILEKEGPRVFKFLFSSDLYRSAHEVLQRAGFGDLLSAISFNIGSHQGIRQVPERPNRLADLFTEG